MLVTKSCRPRFPKPIQDEIADLRGVTDAFDPLLVVVDGKAVRRVVQRELALHIRLQQDFGVSSLGADNPVCAHKCTERRAVDGIHAAQIPSQTYALLAPDGD